MFVTHFFLFLYSCYILFVFRYENSDAIKMWSTIHKVAAIVFISALSKGELPEDDFRIINRQGMFH